MENLSAEWISHSIGESRRKTEKVDYNRVEHSHIRTSCAALLKRIRPENSNFREDLISSELLPSFIRNSTPIKQTKRFSKYYRSGNPTISLRAYIVALIILAGLIVLFAESTSILPAPLSPDPALVEIAPDAPIIMREPPSVSLSASVSSRPTVRQMPAGTLQFRPLEQLTEEEKARLLLFFALMKQKPKVIGNLAIPAEPIRLGSPEAPQP